MPAPFLRSPPFPGVPAHVAAVSAPADHAANEEADDLVEALCRARVGGTFWAPPVPRNDVAVFLRPASVADALAMAGHALSLAGPRSILALLPAERWARAATRALGRLGIAATGPVDPWSVLGPAVLVLAHEQDDYCLLAGLAGARLMVAERGWAAPSPAETQDRFRRAVLHGARYRDPFTGETITPRAAIALLAEWRRVLDANRAIVVATGISRWKRKTIGRFLWSGTDRPLGFARSARAAVRRAQAAGGGIAVWPSRAPAGLHDRAAAAGVPLVRVEDGFVRSVGLGVDLFPPFSIVVDPDGIYYDPSRPSALERLLQHADFTPALLDRAERLRAYILRERISKYGAAGDDAAPPARTGRRRVLVAGQVADDQSVALGGAGVAGNLDLLARARAAEPGAEIWFRPHPDVDAGHRLGAVPDDRALLYADGVMRGGSMAAMLDAVDGVHVLTSLTGFEALLRGLDVTVHGHPFYAGWGLTRDLADDRVGDQAAGGQAGPLARRQRRLTVSELVAGTLILYPRYLDPVTMLHCTPEIMMQRFVDPTIFRPSWLTRLRQVEGRLRRTWNRRD